MLQFYTNVAQHKNDGELTQFSYPSTFKEKEAVFFVDRLKYDDADDSLTFMSSIDSSILFKVTKTEEMELSTLRISHAGKYRNVSKIAWKTFHKATRSLLRVLIVFTNGEQILNYIDFNTDAEKIKDKVFRLVSFKHFKNDFGLSEYSGRIEEMFWKLPEKVATSKIEKPQVDTSKVETKSESSSLRLSIRDEIKGLLEETKHVPLTEAQMLRIKQLIEIRGMIQSRIN